MPTIFFSNFFLLRSSSLNHFLFNLENSNSQYQSEFIDKLYQTNISSQNKKKGRERETNDEIK